MRAKRGTARTRMDPLPVPLEPVQTPASAGWITPKAARALLLREFGATVSVRTLQAWTREPQRPLRHVRIGHRLLIYRDALLARVSA
jgi:hypothetical protein